MALLSRLQRDSARNHEETSEAGDQNRGNAHQELKFRVHNRLFELLDLAKLQKVSEERIREDIAVATRRVLEEEKVLLTLEERDRLVREIQDEVLQPQGRTLSDRCGLSRLPVRVAQRGK